MKDFIDTLRDLQPCGLRPVVDVLRDIYPELSYHEWRALASDLVKAGAIKRLGNGQYTVNAGATTQPAKPEKAEAVHTKPAKAAIPGSVAQPIDGLSTDELLTECRQMETLIDMLIKRRTEAVRAIAARVEGVL